MKTIGIIMECNPFHQGHQYLLETARTQCQADAVVVVMSGDYVQRGEPAICSKYARAEKVLQAGADLVLELPTYIACGGAAYFAGGAVTLLKELGIVDTLVFGSECGDLNRLRKVAETLLLEPEAFSFTLQEALSQGDSYAAARAKALGADFGPNDTLGIEYLRAIRKSGSSMEAIAIPRITCESASDIRSRWTADKKADENLPFPILTTDDFSEALHFRLHEVSDYAEYWDVSEALAHKIRAALPSFAGWDAFCQALKSRDLTYTRISRALLHILLGIRTADVKDYLAVGGVGFARVLGLRKSAAALTAALKEHATVPLITRLGSADPLPAPFDRMLAADIRCAEFYESKLASPLVREAERMLLTIP
ncbi:MAG: nucleotidyltransferase family protein [Lachnospiraceae bacterium]|nr:nucleotidyltransferase family protein [Lachnospiraceae bacterium]